MSEPDGYELEPTEEGATSPDASDGPDASSAPESASSDDEPKARLDAAPLLDQNVDGCPGCGRALAKDAVVCTECGYDLRSNDRLRSSKGVEVVGGDESAVLTDGGRGSLKLLVTVGGMVAFAAMVVAGVVASRVPETGVLQLASEVFRAGYDIVLHTGTGLVAVFLASRIMGMGLGRPDLAAGRVFVAFGVFKLVEVAVLPLTVGELPLGRWLWVPAALGSYFLVAWLLFARARAEVLLLTLAHTVLWAFVKLGEQISQTGGS